MRRFRQLSCIAATLAVVVAGAAPATATPASSTTGPVWGECTPVLDPRQECATLSVPVDYRRPHGQQITIAISRIRAGDPTLRHGILLLNPGGPGGSGLYMPTFLAQTLPAEVTARYDLVGFDPRGVAFSSPITCGIPGNVSADLALPYPDIDGSIERNIRFARAAAASCAASTGALLKHITTANTARDMDRIRAALGERKASYFGYSYGSYLGAVYTTLFPQTSDRVILDSAINPNKIWYDTWRGFSLGTALRLPDFTAWAARRNDIFGLGDTSQAVRDSYFRIGSALDREPFLLPDLGVVINGNLFREVTRSLLYDDRFFGDLAAIWQLLGSATAPAAPTAPAALQRALEIPPDNNIAVLYAIACNDIEWSHDVQMYARNSRVDRLVFPVTAGMPANIWPCAFWPNRPVEPPVKVTDRGPRNVLILQNLRDPATPWVGGVGMRNAFGARAAFVSVDAGGHGIYGNRSGPCTDAIATAFLVTGMLPDRDRFCVGPSPEEDTLQGNRAGGVPARIPSWPLAPGW